jgi:hypothetical protein
MEEVHSHNLSSSKIEVVLNPFYKDEKIELKARDEATLINLMKRSKINVNTPISRGAFPAPGLVQITVDDVFYLLTTKRGANCDMDQSDIDKVYSIVKNYSSLEGLR